MSSMLEQAVIDATALKEAALKNAELMVLEKYAPQIKEALESLLEADEDVSVNVGDPMGGMDAGPAVEDPMAKDLNLAATDGEKTCPCPDDDEEIEIDFDQLAKMGGNDKGVDLPGQTGELEPSDDGMFMEEDNDGVEVPSNLGPELHMYHAGMGDPIYQVGSLAYAGKPVPRDLLRDCIENLERMESKIQDPADKEELENLIMQLQEVEGPQAQEEPSVEQPPLGIHEEIEEEDIELNEEEFLNILESLEVDAVPVPHGHVGHATNSERLDAGQLQLALAQDTQVAEENEEIKKAMEKLQENNNTLKKQINSLILSNNKIKGIALEASKKNQQLNLQNAKLIFKNRAMESVSLNERQKIKIVEAISKVDSVNEAKVLFETLNRSFTSKQDAQRLPKTINEAISKNSSFSFKPRETTESIDPTKERMQKLAGIRKKQD